jgi:hypothetical protein
MIFTRRFGALRARQTFPSTVTIELEEFEAQRKAQLQARKAKSTAKAGVRTHHLFWSRPTGKHRAA